jgi:hypothetical protein
VSAVASAEFPVSFFLKNLNNSSCKNSSIHAPLRIHVPNFRKNQSDLQNPRDLIRVRVVEDQQA